MVAALKGKPNSPPPFEINLSADFHLGLHFKRWGWVHHIKAPHLQLQNQILLSLKLQRLSYQSVELHAHKRSFDRNSKRASSKRNIPGLTLHDNVTSRKNKSSASRILILQGIGRGAEGVIYIATKTESLPETAPPPFPKTQGF